MEDVQMFKDIINEKMIKSLKKCQYKTWLNCFSEVLQCQFQKCLLSPKKNKKKIIKSEKIIPIFENMKEAVNFTHNCNKIKPHNEFFLKRLQKNLSKKYGKTIIDTFKKYVKFYILDNIN